VLRRPVTRRAERRCRGPVRGRGRRAEMPSTGGGGLCERLPRRVLRHYQQSVHFLVGELLVRVITPRVDEDIITT
jgi:hypothetical protein